MTEFERKTVHAYNDFFEQNNLTGYAYRRKQSRYQSQVADVLVDSPDIGYLAIECKSKKAEYGKRINFKSAFPSNDNGHQIPRTSEFAHKTGRTPILAVEYRHGRGKPREAQQYQWDKLEKLYYQDGAKSFTPEDLKECRYKLKREGSKYQLSDTQ